MKLLCSIITVCAIISLGFISKTKSVDRESEIKVGAVKGAYAPVVVLELFTSEGCSSCPPADRLLPELANEAAGVFPLSFHVDYWNRLGWTDPFSNAAFAERQRAYGRHFGLESVYTPQLVINGEYELVGSNRGEAQTVLQKALKKNAAIHLSIEQVKLKGATISFQSVTEGNTKGTSIVAAVVQNHAVSTVKAGENRGATLAHTNVVRCFSKQPATGRNEFELVVPNELIAGGWQLLVYAQQETDLKITGAAVFKPNNEQQ